jgi:hypothetical protein
VIGDEIAGVLQDKTIAATIDMDGKLDSFLSDLITNIRIQDSDTTSRSQICKHLSGWLRLRNFQILLPSEILIGNILEISYWRHDSISILSYQRQLPIVSQAGLVAFSLSDLNQGSIENHFCSISMRKKSELVFSLPATTSDNLHLLIM